MNKSGIKDSLIRLVMVQLSLTLIVTGYCFLLLSPKAALSVLLGALVGIIPHIIFALKAFQYKGAQAAKKIVNGFYKGEALKIILSAALFTAVFRLGRITAPVFFSSYLMILMTHWLAPWIIINKLNRPERD